MPVNKKLLLATMQLIEDNPEHWNQKKWHCGTSHCFAGFVECHLDGIDFKTEHYTKIGSERTNTRGIARDGLGLTITWAAMLFAYKNTLDDLRSLVKILTLDSIEEVKSEIIRNNNPRLPTYELAYYYAVEVAKAPVPELEELILGGRNFTHIYEKIFEVKIPRR